MDTLNNESYGRFQWHRRPPSRVTLSSDSDSGDHIDADSAISEDGYLLPDVVTHPAATTWIGKGRIFPATAVEIPDDLESLYDATMAVPNEIRAAVLPNPHLPVSCFLEFQLPRISLKDAEEQAESCFQTTPARFNLMALKSQDIPPKQFVDDAYRAVGQALLDGKLSIHDPYHASQPLPLWVITLWKELHGAHRVKPAWMNGNSWLQNRIEEGGPDTAIFLRAQRHLALLSWDRLLVGSAASGSITTAVLAGFLSSSTWMSGTLMDSMSACMASRICDTSLVIPQALIVDTTFMLEINRAKDASYFKGKVSRSLRELEKRLEMPKILYAPVFLSEQMHWISLAIDFTTRSFCCGDSYADEDSTIPKPLVRKLQWWLTARFAGPFVDRGLTLPHAKQGDSSSCGIFAINAIEHAVFKQPLCGPNAAVERARWFCLTSSSQCHDRVEPCPALSTALPQAEYARLERERAERRRADREILERSSFECDDAASQQSARRKLIGTLEAMLHMSRRVDNERKRSGHKKVVHVQADLERSEQGGAENEKAELREAGQEQGDLERAEHEKEEREKARQGQENWKWAEQGRATHEKVEREEAWRGQAAGKQRAEHERNDMRPAEVERQQAEKGKGQRERTESGDMVVEASCKQVNAELPPVFGTSRQASPIVSLTSIPSSWIIDRLNNSPEIDNSMTRWVIGQFNRPFVRFNSNLRVPTIQPPLNLPFVSKGRLEVSKRTEVRLRLWRAQYPNVPVWFLAFRCLSRGLDWRVFLSISDLAAHHRSPALPRPAYLDVMPRGLTENGNAVDAYVRQVRRLLGYPHARRFLTMGGLVWRIALHYGPPDLFSAALSPPSTDATLHLHFDRFGSDIDDRVTDGEIDLLLGITDRGSLWPTPDLWWRWQKWQGEWSEDLERWFQERIAVMTSRPLSALLTHARWKSSIRRHTQVALEDPSTVGTEAHAAWLCTELTRLYPSTDTYTALQ
ncbi:hypothetical protein EV424DRAFT_1539897 [Suillus variegatus]|nr:hypothetical protein EV424DRAFT_1539897 [Suillus variegatus]